MIAAVTLRLGAAEDHHAAHARRRAELTGTDRPLQRHQGHRGPGTPARTRRAAPRQQTSRAEVDRPRRCPARSAGCDSLPCDDSGWRRPEPCCAGTPRLVAHHWTHAQQPPGRPPTPQQLRAPVLQMAREKSARGATDGSLAIDFAHVDTVFLRQLSMPVDTRRHRARHPTRAPRRDHRPPHRSLGDSTGPQPAHRRAGSYAERARDSARKVLYRSARARTCGPVQRHAPPESAHQK